MNVYPVLEKELTQVAAEAPRLVQGTFLLECLDGTLCYCPVGQLGAKRFPEERNNQHFLVDWIYEYIEELSEKFGVPYSFLKAYQFARGFYAGFDNLEKPSIACDTYSNNDFVDLGFALGQQVYQQNKDKILINYNFVSV